MADIHAKVETDILSQHDSVVRDLERLKHILPGGTSSLALSQHDAAANALGLLAAYRERLHELETSDLTVTVQQAAEARDQRDAAVAQLQTETRRIDALEALSDTQIVEIIRNGETKVVIPQAGLRLQVGPTLRDALDILADESEEYRYADGLARPRKR
jgi:hypothetical protein